MDQQSDTSQPFLGIVDVETHLGVHYVFPDMELKELSRVLPKGNRMVEGWPTMALVNVSNSALTIPFRIIKKICVRYSKSEETWWESPV